VTSSVKCIVHKLPFYRTAAYRHAQTIRTIRISYRPPRFFFHEPVCQAA
jgi:hypothetical protein